MAEKKIPSDDSIKYPNSTLTFLGTGTSQGVPMIGCNCKVCKSSDYKDQRLRSSVFIEHQGFKILVDCGPDFRQQMLRENITDLDAVLLTHQHKDHTGGLDDIRAFNYFRKSAFPIYAEVRVQDGLKKEYYYAFEEHKYPGVPDYKLITISDKKFRISKELHCSNEYGLLSKDNNASKNQNGSKDKNTLEGKTQQIEIIPIRVMHYKLPILGFRFGNLAYITDGSSIPESEFEKLKGLEVLIINTVRHTKHISHFSLPEALEIIRKVGAPRNYLTHLSHQIGTHAELTEILEMEFPVDTTKTGSIRQQVFSAYDGLRVEF